MSDWLKQNLNTWKQNKLREIPILKKDGTKRILKVPTIADRTSLRVATFPARSYGFTTGRATHDAQKILFSNLQSIYQGIEKPVLELDIEKCFDRINHSTIMDKLIAPIDIETGIFRCLKSGINPGFPEQETLQGGVVSPLLANIALNGIESIHRYKSIHAHHSASSIRYADDMVIILRPQDDVELILEKISNFLAERGLKVSAKKTNLTATTDGFDFLGWYFKVQSNGKFRCLPSVDNFKAFLQKVKHIFNNSNYDAMAKAEKLEPIVRCWRNYHCFCKMNESWFSLYHIKQERSGYSI